MKVEVGKFYKTRDGRKVGPMRFGYGVRGYDWDAGGVYGTCQFYSDTGKADDGHEFDLIAEWTDTPTDVSRAPDLRDLDYTPINLEKPIYEAVPDMRPLEHFHPGPVITETVKRIVPGVYGKVEVTDLGNIWMQPTISRAELIAARDVFSQLIDAMPQE